MMIGISISQTTPARVMFLAIRAMATRWAAPRTTLLASSLSRVTDVVISLSTSSPTTALVLILRFTTTTTANRAPATTDT